MLKYKQPNPLNVFGLRQLEHCPPHFTKIEFDLRVPNKRVTDWIYENLEGRFWFGDYVNTSETGTTVINKAAGFERRSEASYFGLIFDQINSFDYALK